MTAVEVGVQVSPWDRRYLIVAAASVAVITAFVIRFVAALHYSLWQDEVASARIIVQADPVAVARRVAGTESLPPLWYELAWFMREFHVPVVDIRLLSVISGAALAGAAVFEAGRLLPVPGAVFAGALTVFGWQFFEHGWELRPYSLFALMSFVFVVVLGAVAVQPTRARLIVLAVCVSAGALTHYFFLFTVAAGVIWAAITDTTRKTLRRVLAAIAIGLIPFLIWLPILVHQYHHRRFWWIGPFRLRTLAYIDGAFLDRSIDQVRVGRRDAAIALGLLTLVIIGSVRLWRSSPHGRLIACAAVLPIALAAVVWRVGPHVFAARNVIGAAPFACIAIAAGLYALPRRIAAFAAVAGTAIAFINYYDTRAGPPNYRAITNALLAEGWQRNDPIVIFGPFFSYFHPLDWYLPGTPELRVATPRNNRRCNAVYVISVGGRGRAVAIGGQPRPRRINSVVIARIPWSRSIWRELRLRHGAIAASSRAIPPCVTIRR